MGRRLRLAVLLAAGVVLSGCAVTEVGDPPAGADAAETVGDTSVFVEQVKATWVGSLPDEESILEYGVAACAQLAGGEAHDEVVVLEDSSAASGVIAANTRSVVDAAALALCPTAGLD